ncbi:MAG: dTMP kinase [Candidatus Neomarinimicrobiota bacterium]|nr:MAG: dTMP kinase [Candidatus Neomarinimicrobiota bacterium]
MSGSERGRFITFEGIDGCGKSTQVDLLAQRLQNQGISVLCVREPGGTEASEAIRNILLHRRDLLLTGRTEALLMCAARAQLTANKILPALAAGTWVISDRYSDSTLAYQGAGRGLEVDWLVELNRFATQDTDPDLTFYLDLSPDTARKRQQREQDKIEAEGLAFQHKVRAQYRKLQERFPHRFLLLDGELGVQELHQRILNHLNKRGWF